MKKFICTLVFASVLLQCFPVFAHSSQPTVRVQGKELDTAAYIISDISFVPLREVCESLGLNVIWRGQTRSVLVWGQGKSLYLEENSNSGQTAAGEFALGGRCITVNGRFFVPARGLAKGLDIDVCWEDQTRTVVFGEASDDSHQSDDLYWLSRIISAESRGESFEGMLAVGSVVLNRVKSPLFPDTVYRVIFDTNFGTQFTPAANGTVYLEPTRDSVRAAMLCLEGYNAVPGCLYFFNPLTSTSQGWITANRQFCKSIGNHDFYY